jgi:hypothetical protein
MSKHEQVTVDYMHICDYAFPAQNGKPGVIGIFDWIGSPAFPALHPMMCIAVKFHGQAGHVIAFRLAIEGQDGTKVFESPEGQIALSQEGGAFQCFNLVGITFPRPGRYSVVVTTPDAVLATQSLKLLKTEAKAVASA